jgi:hypothetical protein
MAKGFGCVECAALPEHSLVFVLHQAIIWFRNLGHDFGFARERRRKAPDGPEAHCRVPSVSVFNAATMRAFRFVVKTFCRIV